MTWTKSESVLAAVLVQDLRDRGWTVYQEVTSGHRPSAPSGPVCDIVATQGPVLWAIECKLSLGLSVLAQGKAWIGHANLVSVAVPPGKRSDSRHFAMDVARTFGIGVLEVRDPNDVDHKIYRRELVASRNPDAYEVVRPAFSRRCSAQLRACLRPEQQTYAPAGNASGKRYTAFTATCDLLREILGRRGPLTIREAVEAMGKKHHYASEASARGSLFQWAHAGKIDGVTIDGNAPARVMLIPS